MFTLKSFYRSNEWEEFRKLVISERIQRDGCLKDDITGKPILKAYDCILHHKTELTDDNVNDFSISLNPDNIQIVSFRTHNDIHKRFGYGKASKRVYLIYGAPCAGKQSYVDSISDINDIVINIDRLWKAIKSSNCGEYEKPNNLKSVIFSMRDNLLDMIKTRYGKWENAFIIGGYPLISDRESLIDSLGVDRVVLIDTPKEECILRAKAISESYVDFVEQWFERFTK